MPFKLKFTKIAEKDILLLKKNEPHTYKKVWELLNEVVVNPFSGKGRP